MRTFLLLSSLSPQGLQTLATTPERLFEVNREIERLGGRVVKQWALLGAYDFLSVVEAPDELHHHEAHDRAVLARQRDLRDARRHPGRGADRARWSRPTRA